MKCDRRDCIERAVYKVTMRFGKSTREDGLCANCEQERGDAMKAKAVRMTRYIREPLPKGDQP